MKIYKEIHYESKDEEFDFVVEEEEKEETAENEGKYNLAGIAVCLPVILFVLSCI